MPNPSGRLKRRIRQGRGLEVADIVLRGGRVFDLITGELVESDVAICGDQIVGVFDRYEGKTIVDCIVIASDFQIFWNRIYDRSCDDSNLE